MRRFAVTALVAVTATAAALLVVSLFRSVSTRAIALLALGKGVESIWTMQLIDRFVWIGMGIAAVAVVVVVPWAIAGAGPVRRSLLVFAIELLAFAGQTAFLAATSGPGRNWTALALPAALGVVAVGLLLLRHHLAPPRSTGLYKDDIDE